MRRTERLPGTDDADAAANRTPPGAGLPPRKPRLPRHERALRVARHVHAAGWISRSEAANAAGVKPSAVAPILRIALDAGWVVTRGSGGICPGPVTPPPAA